MRRYLIECEDDLVLKDLHLTQAVSISILNTCETCQLRLGKHCSQSWHKKVAFNDFCSSYKEMC